MKLVSLRKAAMATMLSMTLATVAMPAVAEEATSAQTTVTPVEVAVGEKSTCVVNSIGSVKCWGDNSFGELGDGSTVNSESPVRVVGLPTAKFVAVGVEFACAITRSKTVWCWGSDTIGQLGTVQRQRMEPPTQVSGLDSGVTSLSLGTDHACAVMESGAVMCWGENWLGQIGDGSVNIAYQPVTVQGLPAAALTVSAGESHSCAVLVDGSAWCWGDNTWGQLGTGGTVSSLVPVEVSGLVTGVQSINASGANTCAVLVGGAAKCWGANAASQTGVANLPYISCPWDPGASGIAIPMDVYGLGSGVVAISGGFAHPSASILVGIGLGDPSSLPSDPHICFGIDNYSRGSHTCALLTDGSVACWGFSSQWGSLGDGGTGGHGLEKVLPSLRDGVTNLGVGIADHQCAIRAGEVYCWGNNKWGQVGNGPLSTSYLQPVSVEGLGSGMTSVVTNSFACGLDSFSTVWCWGRNMGQLGNDATQGVSLPVAVRGLSGGVASISLGDRHACALMLDGSVYCWGANYLGQLGDGTTTNSVQAVRVKSLTSPVVALTAGADYTCALMSDGSVKCWGLNGAYAVHDSYPDFASLLPVPVPGLPGGIKSITTGFETTCALSFLGSVWCWGRNSSGELGDGTTVDGSVTAVAVSGLPTGVTSIVSGFQNFCALTMGGTVLCWGDNRWGQLQLDKSIPFVSSATPIGDLPGAIVSVIAGGYNICAETNRGLWYCWGDNTFGERGNYSADSTVEPTASPILDQAISPVSFDYGAACGVFSGGIIKCWGSNNGQISTTADTPTSVPLKVLTNWEIPAAVGSVSAIAGNQSIAVAWSPASNADSTITNYVATATDLTNSSNPGSSCVYTTSMPELDSCTVPNLTHDRYSVTVTAYSVNGPGPTTAYSGVVIPSTPPDAPGNVTTLTGDQSATVNWSPPLANGAPILDYTVTAHTYDWHKFGFDGDGNTCRYTVSSPEVDSCRVLGLVNGDMYTFTVSARNADGNGPSSEPSSVMVLSTVPDAPTYLVLSVWPNQINAYCGLDLFSPATGFSPVTSFILTLSPGGVSRTTGPNGCSAVFEGLTNGVRYSVTVVAVNANGSSLPSQPVFGVPASVPTSPTVSTPTRPASGQLKWNWSPNSTGGSPITTYTWTGACSGSGNVTSVTCSNLTGGSNYTLSVSATNAVGTSDTSSSSLMATSVPGTAIVHLSPGNGSLSVTWTAPWSTGGSAIRSYTVTASAADGRFSCTSSGLACTIVGLTNGKIYSVSVVATNAIGSSLASSPVSAYPAPDTNFVAFSPASVAMVKSNFPVLVANAKVASTVTVIVGGATKTCVANEVGECSVILKSTTAGSSTITAIYLDGKRSYTSHGVYRIALASITTPSNSIAKGKTFVVKITSGLPGSTFTVTTSTGLAYSTTLAANGSGIVTVPTKNKGSLLLSISDNAIILQTTTITVV